MNRREGRERRERRKRERGMREGFGGFEIPLDGAVLLQKWSEFFNKSACSPFISEMESKVNGTKIKTKLLTSLPFPSQ